MYTPSAETKRHSEILLSHTNIQPGTTWTKNLSVYTTVQSGLSDILSNIQ